MTVRSNHVYLLLLAGICLVNSSASWAGEPPDVTPTVRRPPPAIEGQRPLPPQPSPPAPVDPRLPPELPQPVAPGAVQTPPGGRIDPAKETPRMWAFADIKVKVLGPTGTRLDWHPREDATFYRVLRNDVPIIDIPAQAPPLTFTDDGLTPGTANAYRIVAIQSNSAFDSPPARTPPNRQTSQILEESRIVWATTPPLDPALDLTATSFSSAAVRFTWTAPAWAKGHRLWRDRQLVKPHIGGNSYDDTSVPAGTHVYAVQSMYARLDGTPIPGPISKEVTIRVGPFVVVALGDSVMWGQGLADAPGSSHKFAPKVRDWLSNRMGKDVQLISFAHSGARITAGSAAEESKITPGEVPNSFPSILNQANVQSRRVANPADVDLVIVDGCVNDVGVALVLNPATSNNEIVNRSKIFCDSGMFALLGVVHTVFPRARIVVTGYFPIVSQSSDLTAVAVLLLSSGAVAATVAPLLGIPLDPLTGLIAGAVTSPLLKQNLVGHSDTFFTVSGAHLLKAVNNFNSRFGNFASFAHIPYLHQNAYAAPDSWLWLVPTDLFPKDEVFMQRAALCQDDSMLRKTVTSPGDLTTARAKCVEASMGHPNVKGAQVYTDAITAQLTPFLAQWKATHQSVQHAR